MEPNKFSNFVSNTIAVLGIFTLILFIISGILYIIDKFTNFLFNNNLL